MKVERRLYSWELLRQNHEYLEPWGMRPGREDVSLLRKYDAPDYPLDRDLDIGIAREASLAGVFVNSFPRNPKAHSTLDKLVS